MHGTLWIPGGRITCLMLSIIPLAIRLPKVAQTASREILNLTLYCHIDYPCHVLRQHVRDKLQDLLLPDEVGGLFVNTQRIVAQHTGIHAG